MQSVIIPPQLEPMLVQSVVLFDPETKSYVGSAINPLQVQVTNASTADRELLVTMYRCKSAFTGASVGDTITGTRVLDVTASTATQIGATLWRNESTSLDLVGVPSVSNLELSGTVGLTDAQLRAALLKTEPLGVPTVARQVIATNTNTNTVLTTTCRRISIKARTNDVRFALGSVAQTASATTSHFIEAGERLDMAVPLNANIAVIRDSAATANAVVEITELA